MRDKAPSIRNIIEADGANNADTKHKRRSLILDGYRLTTAEILYRMPDHPSFLQTYLWQELDLAPRFPVLRKFLEFWENNLDSPLHSVRVASSAIVTPQEMTFADEAYSFH